MGMKCRSVVSLDTSSPAGLWLKLLWWGSDTHNTMSSQPSNCCDDPCKPNNSRCNGPDRRCNSWVDGADPVTGEGGICLLDQLTDDEIACILQKNPFARVDLPKATTDPALLALLEKYPLFTTNDAAETLMNRIGAGDAPLAYTVIGGRWSDFL